MSIRIFSFPLFDLIQDDYRSERIMALSIALRSDKIEERKG